MDQPKRRPGAPSKWAPDDTIIDNEKAVRTRERLYRLKALRIDEIREYQKEYQKKYRAENREKLLEQARLRAERNKANPEYKEQLRKWSRDAYYRDHETTKISAAAKRRTPEYKAKMKAKRDLWTPEQKRRYAEVQKKNLENRLNKMSPEEREEYRKTLNEYRCRKQAEYAQRKKQKALNDQ